MSAIGSCYNNTCEYNHNGCCEAFVVEISSTGECLTFIETDIYKEVEGFSR